MSFKDQRLRGSVRQWSDGRSGRDVLRENRNRSVSRNLQVRKFF